MDPHGHIWHGIDNIDEDMHDDDVGDDDDDVLPATITDLPSGLHVT